MTTLDTLLPMAPSNDIGPGLWAFIAFFALAVALWLLMRNMNTRVRNITYRARADEEAAAAARAAREQGQAAGTAAEDAETAEAPVAQPAEGTEPA